MRDDDGSAAGLVEAVEVVVDVSADAIVMAKVVVVVVVH